MPNPAEPPMIMRDTVFALSSGADEETIDKAVRAMVDKLRAYVPGYRLKQALQFERFGSNDPVHSPGLDPVALQAGALSAFARRCGMEGGCARACDLSPRL